MKLSKSEAKTEAGLVSGPSDKGPRYPYGLELRLGNEALDKLKDFDPDVGTEVVIEARGLITAYRESQRQGRDPDRSAEIQITDLALDEAPEKKREKASAKHIDELFGR